ncbi:MAG: hypothetical protein ACREVK_01590 [Gammaproteobacteria bacterium]
MRSTASISALQDLELEHLWILYPGVSLWRQKLRRYQLVGLARLGPIHDTVKPFSAR